MLNAEFVITLDSDFIAGMQRVMSSDHYSLKIETAAISLKNIRLIKEPELEDKLGEDALLDKGAIKNSVEFADGLEIFVRLSAFSNDRRIDFLNKKLLPGTYTTTEEDYVKCKASNDDPIERYALPNNYIVKHAFHVVPVKSDSFQRGIVQPAYSKQGGGVEAYFAVGTSNGYL